MVSFEEFTIRLSEFVKEAFPDKSIHIAKINKKGRILTGITVSDKISSDDSVKLDDPDKVHSNLVDSRLIETLNRDKNNLTLGYTSYVDDLYFDNMTEEEINKAAKKLISVLKKGEDANKDAFIDQVNELMSFDKAKEKIYFELEPVSHSEELDNAVTFFFHDIRIVYKLRIQLTNINRDACMVISKELLDMWGVTKDEIHDLAMKNMQKMFTPKIDKLIVKTPKETMKNIFYKITNTNGEDGASVVFHDNVMKELCQEIGASSMYVFFASMHHALVFDCSKIVFGRPKVISNYNERLLLDLLKLNIESVAVDDWLSSSLFRYTLEDDRLDQVASMDSIHQKLGLAAEDIVRKLLGGDKREV